MKHQLFCGLGYLLLICSVSACKAPENNPDMRKIWIAQQVKENDVVVYTFGSQENLYPGYTAFQIHFMETRVAYTEFSGEMFEGNWSLTGGNEQLILTNLSPEPYGTGGTLVFTLVTWQPNRLVLRRETPNPKSGDSINEYILVPK